MKSTTYFLYKNLIFYTLVAHPSQNLKIAANNYTSCVLLLYKQDGGIQGFEENIGYRYLTFS